MTWVNNNGNSIAYQLKKAKCDVWLLNDRFTTISNPNHISLSTNDEEYWSSSFHNVGYFDIPACTDYILDHTGRKKLTYVGHSMGTTTMFTAMSDSRKDFMDKKLSAFVALAPVVRMADVHGGLELTSSLIP